MSRITIHEISFNNLYQFIFVLLIKLNLKTINSVSNNINRPLVNIITKMTELSNDYVRINEDHLNNNKEIPTDDQAALQDQDDYVALEGGDKQVALEKDPNYDPKKGALLMIVFTLMQAINWLAVKNIYIHVPYITGTQIMMGRAIISSIVVSLYIGKDMKKALWQSVPNDQWFNLLFRCIQGFLSKYFMYSAF